MYNIDLSWFWFAKLKFDLGKKAGCAIRMLWMISLFKLSNDVNKLVKVYIHEIEDLIYRWHVL